MPADLRASVISLTIQPPRIMITSQYKTGVLNLIARIKNYNPEIGQYISHSLAHDKEFVIRLSNGTLKVPPEVAHSQEVFPALVPEAWIMEIERSYVKNHAPVQVDEEPRSKWKLIVGFFSRNYVDGMNL